MLVPAGTELRWHCSGLLLSVLGAAQLTRSCGHCALAWQRRLRASGCCCAADAAAAALLLHLPRWKLPNALCSARLPSTADARHSAPEC